MTSALTRYLEAASGLTNLTKNRAEQVVRGLVKQGGAAADQAGDLVDDLLERSKKNRETVTALVTAETQRVIGRMGLATRSEVERLERQVANLKRDLAAASSSGPAAKKATGKPAANKTAKKAAAKKATKKPAAKKTAAKKATKKTAR